MSIKLRPLQAADENAWRELFSDYGSFYKIEVPDAAFAEVLRWIQDPDEPFWCTVAEDDWIYAIPVDASISEWR